MIMILVHAWRIPRNINVNHLYVFMSSLLFIESSVMHTPGLLEPCRNALIAYQTIKIMQRFLKEAIIFGGMILLIWTLPDDTT